MKKLTMNLTVKQMSKKIQKGEFAFDNEIQRACVWDLSRKTMLINTVLRGFVIPPVYTRRDELGRFDVLDGKQRCTTLAEFVSGGFALGDLELTQDGEKVNLKGLTFEKLTEEQQDTILDTSLLIYYFEDITEEEIEEIFRRLNNGKPLSTKEINWAHCGDREHAKILGKHELFEQMFTEKGIARRSQIPVVYKLYDIITNGIDCADYSAGAMNNLMSNAQFNNDDMVDLYELFSTLECILKDIKRNNKDAYKKARRETNLVSFAGLINEITKEDTMTNELVLTLSKFYSHFMQFPPTAYTEANSNGVGKNSNITARHDALCMGWDVWQEQKENGIETVNFEF